MGMVAAELAVAAAVVGGAAGLAKLASDNPSGLQSLDRTAAQLLGGPGRLLGGSPQLPPEAAPPPRPSGPSEFELSQQGVSARMHQEAAQRDADDAALARARATPGGFQAPRAGGGEAVTLGDAAAAEQYWARRRAANAGQVLGGG